tara:strand:+ start:1322 stop:1438 length:117 start_codon:yes stop_codon:yes gene_type:complete
MHRQRAETDKDNAFTEQHVRPPIHALAWPAKAGMLDSD